MRSLPGFAGHRPAFHGGFCVLDGLFLHGRRVPANLPVGRDLTIRCKIENGRYYCALGRSFLGIDWQPTRSTRALLSARSATIRPQPMWLPPKTGSLPRGRLSPSRRASRSRRVTIRTSPGPPDEPRDRTIKALRTENRNLKSKLDRVVNSDRAGATTRSRRKMTTRVQAFHVLESRREASDLWW
jgi:hypothetical protein